MDPAVATRTATVEQTLAGIIVIRIRPEMKQELCDARENVAAGAALSAGRRLPLIVDIRHAAPLTVEVRHYYAGTTLTDNFAALGLLVPVGAFGRMFGNVYLRIASPGIPSRLFDAEEQALAWAHGFLP